MKTDELINALVADTAVPPSPVHRIVWIAAALAALVTGAVFFAWLPVRGDMASALTDPRFLFKWAFTLSLFLSALAVATLLMRPEQTQKGPLLLLAAAPAILIVGIILELIALPAEQWLSTMVGMNSHGCIVTIPFLALAPLSVLLMAIKKGAPTRPAFAGAVAGLAATGIAASYYAMYCRDDSPLFLATWYILSALLVAAVGALIGSRLLRW
ncbi:NrsF family protein [Hyphomicrobium sulfonivorans]|uniref:NrsF family protein n=1 Tax=Hyphomicrobium sulfonivorans TaxID=121290 RepID=UPI00156F3F13|nr:DUF1109 domain-containing protein [Hyphomicrobium sulfonivorans]MBI1649159.1 DUF1109 family protein [Hyphomicrobium sulfonivorans]NSL70310.1 DUF1109 domain-containing protein [Hyphomicrobium sulfonivorans]